MTIEPATHRSRRMGRSRKYPAESLERVIDRASTIYEAEGRHTAPVSAIVRHWGYGSHTSGAASSAYSAVRQFGLIDEEGRGEERMATLTDLAFEILRSPEPAAAIRAAMLNPPVHRQMWDMYGSELPSERTLQWKLVREMGFTETGATEFLKQYKESLAFALLRGALDEERSEIKNESEALTSASGASSVASPLVMEQPVQDVWRRSDTEERHYVSHTGPTPTERTKRHAIPLAGGKQVVLEGDFPLSEVAWNQFLVVLEAFKPGLVDEVVTAGRGHSDDVPAPTSSKPAAAEPQSEDD